MILGITASGFAGGLSVSDNFNRADGPLGVTPTNSLPWQTLSGSFSVSSNRAVSVPSNATSGLAVVDNFASNVNLSLGVSNGGGDALYFRVVDSNNWWRAGVNSVTTTQSFPTGYTAYTWVSYRSGAEYYPTTAQYGAGCQQTYHDHVTEIYGYGPWPSRTIVTTSSSPPPTGTTSSTAYPSITHTHSLVLAGCGQTVTFTSHTHVGTTYLQSSQFVVTGSTTSTVTTTSVVLEKSVSGVITSVGTVNVSSISSIQVSANGSSISVRKDGEGSNLISTTSTDHSTATKHGLGRRASSNNNTSIDNFTATPIGGI